MSLPLGPDERDHEHRLDQVVVPELLTPMEEPEGIEEDSYRGSSGWVVVFGGEGGGRSVYAEVGPGFGALRWWINESGLDDPDDADLGAPDEGFWRVHARAHAGRCPETGVQDDLYFSRESEWEAVERDPSAETGWVKAGDSSHAALAQELADLKAKHREVEAARDAALAQLREREAVARLGSTVRPPLAPGAGS